MYSHLLSLFRYGNPADMSDLESLKDEAAMDEYLHDESVRQAVKEAKKVAKLQSLVSKEFAKKEGQEVEEEEEEEEQDSDDEEEDAVVKLKTGHDLLSIYDMNLIGELRAIVVDLYWEERALTAKVWKEDKVKREERAAVRAEALKERAGHSERHQKNLLAAADSVPDASVEVSKVVIGVCATR